MSDYMQFIDKGVIYFTVLKKKLPVPVSDRSKAQVYGRSPAEIVVSNSAGGMDVCLLSVLCVVR